MNGDDMTVTPDYAELQPSVEFICTSSRAATGRVSVSDNAILWYFNDTEITFGSDGVSTNFGGLFKKVGYDVSSTVRGQKLQLLGNVVEIAGKASCTIKAVVAIVDGTISDTVQATYPIAIQQSSGKSYRVTITSGDKKNFVIDEVGGSCVLKAMTYFNGSEGNGAYTYQWYKLNGTDWEALGTEQTQTVSGDDIDTYGEFRCVVYLDGTEIGADVQGVMDTTDPYIVIPNPTPNNEVISEGSGGSVVYEPYVATRGGTKLDTQPLFSFQALSQTGNKLGSAADASSFTVTEDMCVQAGGDVSLIITSNKF
jgi:hypothetical protein